MIGALVAAIALVAGALVLHREPSVRDEDVAVAGERPTGSAIATVSSAMSSAPAEVARGSSSESSSTASPATSDPTPSSEAARPSIDDTLEAPAAIASITLSPAQPVQFEPTTITVTFSNIRYDDRVALFTDEPLVGRFPGANDLPAPDCGRSDVFAAQQTITFTVSFVVAGPHEPRVALTPCAAVSKADYVVRAFEFDVAQNGPSNLHFAPTVESRTWTTGDLTVSVSDADGVADQLLVDWGDGSPVEEYGYSPLPSETGCNAATDYVPSVRVFQAGVHAYATPGAHTITFTVRTVGCDGLNPQTQTGSAFDPASNG